MAERKWMYVLRGTGESHPAWSKRMKRVARDLLALEPSKLQLTVTEAPPPKLSLFPFKSQPIAILNVYAEGDDPSRRHIRSLTTEPGATESPRRRRFY
jgi:hypothetical protein